MVSQSVVISLYVALTIFISFPILLLVIYKIKTKTSAMPYIVGAVIYFLFAMLGETLCHGVFLNESYPMASVINGNAFLYVLYHALVTGIFEGFGIYFTYRAIMKPYDKRENGVTFGFGFAGMECLLLEGVSMFTNIFFVSLLNEEGVEGFKASFVDVGAAQTSTLSEVDELIEKLTSIGIGDIALSCLERMIYFVLQLSICVLIYYGVRKHAKQIVWAGFIARSVCAIPSALVSYIGNVNPIVGMSVLAMLTAAVFYAALKLHKNFNGPLQFMTVKEIFVKKE